MNCRGCRDAAEARPAMDEPRKRHRQFRRREGPQQSLTAGVRRKAALRALVHLESAGLVEIKQVPGQVSEVTIRSIGGT